MNELHNIFKAFTEAETWPEELEHLKRKTLCRKKDNALYRISRPSGQYFGGKPAAYLIPVGDNWPIISRSHWKTYAKILTDFTVKE